MAKFGKYVQESYDELLHKVTWPTWPQLQSTTIIVLVAMAIITLLIFGMDAVSEGVIKVIYGVQA